MNFHETYYCSWIILKDEIVVVSGIMSVIQEQFNNNPEKNMVLIKMDKGRQNKHKKMRNSASISSSCSGGDNASSSCDSVIGGQHDSTK